MSSVPSECRLASKGDDYPNPLAGFPRLNPREEVTPPGKCGCYEVMGMRGRNQDVDPADGHEDIRARSREV